MPSVGEGLDEAAGPGALADPVGAGGRDVEAVGAVGGGVRRSDDTLAVVSRLIGQSAIGVSPAL